MPETRELRFAPRDRVWLGVNNIQLITTAEPLDLAAMTARMQALAEAEPGLRFFTRTSGRYPDRYRDAATPGQAMAACDGLVRPLGPAAAGQDVDQLDLDAAADAAGALLDADDGRPVPAVFAGHGMVGQRFPHVFGDGLSAISHLRRLAIGPEPASTAAPFPIHGLPHPLTTALRERYRATPRRVLDELRADRPAPRTSAPPVVSTTANSVQVLFRLVDTEAMNELKAYRKAHLPGVSTMAMVTAALRRGLAREHLIPADDGMFVVFDLRSYLPRGGHTGGNFISASYLRPADPLSAASINDELKAAQGSGRPLLGLTVGSARLAARRHTPVPASRRPATGRDVAFSHMRVSRVLPAAILAAPGAKPAVLAAATPGSVGSISYTLVETGAQLSVTAVFCAPFTPRDRMAAVLDDLQRSPAELLAAGA